MYVCIHIHIHIHIYMYTYIHVCVFVCAGFEICTGTAPPLSAAEDSNAALKHRLFISDSMFCVLLDVVIPAVQVANHTVHESFTADTRDHEDHTFSGMMCWP